jgi:hypothetical protein
MGISPRYRLGAALLVVGLMLIATYEGLKHGHVGKIGADTDIGGGGIFLLGFVLALAVSYG